MAAIATRFTEDQADKILRLNDSGVPEEELGRRYGVPAAAVGQTLKDARSLRDDKRRQRDRRLNR